MEGSYGELTAMRYFKFFLSCNLAFSVFLLTPMNGARSAHAGESVQEESTGQGMDMDRHDHAEATVDMMVPHQQHQGPHMKWTTLRLANEADARRADDVVLAFRERRSASTEIIAPPSGMAMCRCIRSGSRSVIILRTRHADFRPRTGSIR